MSLHDFEISPPPTSPYRLSSIRFYTKRLFHRIALSLSRNLTFITKLLLLYFILLPTVLFVLLGYVFPSTYLTFPPQLRDSRHALVVVAHPDDESLFFSPSILGMTGRRQGVGDVGLLVLSSGE
jgi:hypothetical protein